MLSPCISVCRYINSDEKICEGCFRTAEEIADWYQADESRKLEILKSCQKRKQDLEYKKDLTILTKITRIMNS